MKLLRSWDKALNVPTVAAIGNFDGVHLGHHALLSAARARATELGFAMLVIIFEPQTREYFLKDRSPPRLMSLRDKVQALRQWQVDYLCCLRFDHRLARMSAHDFADSIIFKQLHVKYLYVGEDFRFGADRLGDINLLKAEAQKFDARLETFVEVGIAGERVSSTRIRQALAENDLLKAKQLLGRDYSLSGRVLYGSGMAKSFGTPTANIKLGKGRLALQGVFCVRVRTETGMLYSGLANIGFRPTFNGKKPILEAHLFDFSGDLYGQMLDIEFLHKLRDEIKFSSKEELIAQIKRDQLNAKLYFDQLRV